MFYNRTTNNRINQLPERALQLVYNDYDLSFNEFLEKDKSFTLHVYNIQTLLTKMFMVCNNLSETIFSYLFITQKKHLLNVQSKQRVNTVWSSSNSVRYFGLIWFPQNLNRQAFWKISGMEFINGNLRNTPAEFNFYSKHRFFLYK